MSYSQTIEANYAAMQNGELLALLNDWESLTDEAKIALKQALATRNLPKQGEITAQYPITGSHLEAGKITFEQRPNAQQQQFLKKALEQKKAGIPYPTLMANLWETGLTDDEAYFLWETMGQKAGKLKAEAENDQQSATIRLFCGIAVLTIAFLAQLNSRVYALGLLIIIYSIVQIAIAGTKKSKYELFYNDVEEE